jgi:hypothetical protein
MEQSDRVRKAELALIAAAVAWEAGDERDQERLADAVVAYRCVAGWDHDAEEEVRRVG